MRIVVQQGVEKVADLSFEDEDIYIGSAAGCDIHLPGEPISTRQARIYLSSESRWEIENLDPSFELRLNDRVVTENTPLKNKDEVIFRSHLLRVFPVEKVQEEAYAEPRLGTEELARIKQYPLPPGSAIKRHFDPTQLQTPQLDALGRISIALGGARDIHELVEVALDLLVKTFNARCAWIGLRRKPHGELDVIGGKLASGQVFESNPLVEYLQYRCLERVQHICIRKVRDQEDIGTAMAVPVTAGRNTYGMIYVDRRIKLKRFQTPDLELLSALGCQLAAKVDAIFAGLTQRGAATSSAEITLVREIQAQLDPKTPPGMKNLQLAVYARAGQESAGDVYDVMKHPDDEITTFLIAHVHAAGGPLALAMARLHSTFRVAVLHNDPPHAFARALNWLMKEAGEAATIDFICLRIDPATGQMKFARGGKIGGFVIDAQGGPRPLKHASEQRLGMVANFEYNLHADQLTPGATLVLYSRGVITVTNAQNERFSEARFIELLCDGFGQLPAATAQDFSDELAAFLEHGQQPDDITLMLLQRAPELM